MGGAKVWRAVLVFVVVLAPHVVLAQHEVPNRWELGIDLTGIVATGEFQQFIDAGGGLNLSGVYQFDARRHIGLRIDGTIAMYGHERFQVPLLPSTGRILVDVTTNNLIFGLGIGPQITFSSGRIRPFLYGTIGFSYFATISSVGGSAEFDDFASTTNFSDLTASASFGGGITWRVSSGHHPIRLSVSTQYLYNGTTEYLTRGGIVDNPDGSVTIFPIRSQANYVAIRLGMVIGL